MHSEDEGLGSTKYKVRFGVNQSVCSLSLSCAWGPIKVPGLQSPANTLIGFRGVRNEHSTSSGLKP